MRVPVVVVEVPTRWRFRDSDTVHRWLAGRPWAEEFARSPPVLRLAASDYVHEVATALTACAHGHDEGRSDLRVRQVLMEANESLQQAIERALDARGGDPLERLRSISASLRRSPHLIVVVAPKVAGELFDDACGFLDRLTKLDPGEPKRGCLCIIDTLGQPVSAEAFDFVTGWPELSVLGRPGERARDTWDRYLIARLAWEAGGDIGSAKEIESTNPLLAPPDHEDALEGVFNRAALALSARRPAAVLDQVTGWLTGVVAAASSRKPRPSPSPPDELLLNRLAWSPSPGGAWRPVPWLARAMLLKNALPGADLLLRSCLVNAPLGSELFRRTLELEAGYLAGMQARTPPVAPPFEAMREFAEFQRARPEGLEFFPSGCPAIPKSPWEFASLGALVALEGERRDGPKHLLRDVRNAIAHGAYVGWSMVKAVARCERELAVRS